MEIFKNGTKAYVAIKKTEAIKPTSKVDALTIANKYFKTRKDDLEIQSGTIKGDTLTIGKGNVWVVSRKEKA